MEPGAGGVRHDEPGEVVLVTGAPSLAARRMVEHILDREAGTQIVLLVLERFIPRVAAHLDELGKDARSRVEVLEGDAAAIDLGLSGAEYLALAERVTRVHHLAQVSFVGATKEEAESTNVGGAREMVELGRAARERGDRLRCIVHHSTAQVSGDRQGVVREDELDEGQGFHNPVQRSRFVAEKVLRRAMGQLPIAVVRPTMLVGDSVTGQVDRLDGPYLLATLVLGIPGELDVPLPKLGPVPLDIVPIDFVVEAAHAIGLDRSSSGRTFHLTSGEDLTARDVFAMIARAGGRRVSDKAQFPAQFARRLSRAPGLKTLLRQPAELLRTLTTHARHDTTNARRVLEPLGIRCPPVASYVETWVEAVRQRDDR